MALDVVSYVLSMGYASSSLTGAGALKGQDGTDGKSAYEIAKDNGFVGTEQEWLDSLKMDTTELETVVQQEVANQLGTEIEDTVNDAINDNLATDDLDFSNMF